MQVLRGVREMNDKGMRHNDVHPENIHIEGERSSSVRLLDFGTTTPIATNFKTSRSAFTAPEEGGDSPVPNTHVAGLRAREHPHR